MNDARRADRCPVYGVATPSTPASVVPAHNGDGASLPRRPAGTTDFSENEQGGAQTNTNNAPFKVAKIASAVAAALFLCSCTVSQPDALRRSVNDYYYWTGEYTTECVTVKGPDVCQDWHGRLVALKERIKAAEEANDRGGKAPLQFDALDKARKAAAK